MQRPNSPVLLALSLTVSTSAPFAAAQITSAGSHQPSGASRPAIPFELVEVANGFGQLLPHHVFRLDASGQPTLEVIEIRSFEDLTGNVTPGNPILPTPTWPPTAVLPNGLRGNHFVYARFSSDIDVHSVLDDSPAGQASSGLLGTVTVTVVDPLTGTSTLIAGRAFVGGKTFAGTPSGNPPVLSLQGWIQPTPGGGVAANPAVDNDQDGVADGLGFPGTVAGTSFAGAGLLADPRVFVFVPDADGDLTTFEAFPAGGEIRLRVHEGVSSIYSADFGETALASSTTGPDLSRPEVALTALGVPIISPAPGDVGVDPQTTIEVEFNQPVEPTSVGPFPGLTGLSTSIQLSFGPAAQTTVVPFTALPMSVFHLGRYELTPAFAFPGEGPLGPCGAFNQVDVTVIPGQLLDFSGNVNAFPTASFFSTGPGPGLVNAPVAPDAIYAASAGANAALSVVDLNGFGASTGDPTYIPGSPQPGHSNYPNNPNVKFQGSLLFPPLAPGVCTFDGGSSGVFTRTRDSNLSPALFAAPVVMGVDDMMLGHALDGTFNNAPAPFGCQAGGGNLCALDGLKQISFEVGGANTLTPTTSVVGILGAPNLISWAPHPNPPPLNFPPICVAPLLGALSPTSVESVHLANLLVPGDPFGDPANGIPPSGLLTPEQNAFFRGPSVSAFTIAQCTPYQIRQQIGHYLYSIDRISGEVVVSNSNRMQVIDRIGLPDPTSLAMSPELDLLAVTNRAEGTVSFIDTDPTSASMHQVVETVFVGAEPRGIAWEPGNEDVLVCNEGDDTVSIISAFSLTVRKVVAAGLDGPFDVAITPRQDGFGFQRNVYFAYIVGRDGRVSVFESGPSGINGWGYDDVIGQYTAVFEDPKAIQADPLDLRSAVWIAHEAPLPNGQPGEGALSKLVFDTGTSGQLLLTPANVNDPQFRDMNLRVTVSIGEDQLSGPPVDIAFDNLRNFGGLTNVHTTFSAGAPAPVNGKGLVRILPAGGFANTSEAAFVFAAVPSGPGGGVVDVVDLVQLIRRDVDAFQPGIQSIGLPGASVLMDYFRQ